MNKSIIVLPVLLLLGSLLCACQPPSAAASPASQAQPGMQTASPAVTAAAPSSSPSSVEHKAVGVYKDGTYTYIGLKDGEGYYVKASMAIKDGRIVSMDWQILDSNHGDQVFDDRYENIYAGNDLYIQQCRDNMKGLVQFVPRLLQVQDPDQVDTVSGATWVYDKFEEAAKALLKQAEVK